MDSNTGNLIVVIDFDVIQPPKQSRALLVGELLQYFVKITNTYHLEFLNRIRDKYWKLVEKIKIDRVDNIDTIMTQRWSEEKRLIEWFADRVNGGGYLTPQLDRHVRDAVRSRRLQSNRFPLKKALANKPFHRLIDFEIKKWEIKRDVELKHILSRVSSQCRFMSEEQQKKRLETLLPDLMDSMSDFPDNNELDWLNDQIDLIDVRSRNGKSLEEMCFR